MSSDRWRQRIVDICDNILAIESYVEDLDAVQFAENRVIVDACERCLQRITEAAIKVGEARMIEVAPSIPFHELRGFGNRLRHNYDDIDPGILYNTITDELPNLLRDCRKYLENYP